MKRNIINALYVKEIKQITRKLKFPTGLLFFCLVPGIIGIITLSTLISPDYLTYFAYRSIKESFSILYEVIFGLEFMLALFLTPAFTAGLVSAERENRTLDLMLTSSLSPHKIALGKLLFAVTRLFFYITGSMPVLFLVFAVGELGATDIAEYLLLLVVTVFYAGSFGVLISVIFKNTTLAVSAAYVLLLFLTIGIGAIVFINALLNGNYLAERGGTDYISMLNPAAVLFAMFDRHVGYSGGILYSLGLLNKPWEKHGDEWFFISLAVQGAISVINITLAGFLLDPMRKKRG